MIINLLAEGYIEEFVASRLLPFCGHEIGVVYGKQGSNYVRKKASYFRFKATNETGVLVLTDFRDTGTACIPDALEEYVLGKLPFPPKTFLCRFAVSEIESWLLADREGMAKFLGVATSRLPHHPEKEEYPKKTLVKLACSSRVKRIRNGLAPPPGHRAEVGPEYTVLLHEFIRNSWDIESAMSRSESLKRCVHRLQTL